MLEDMEKKTISVSELAKNAERIARDVDASGTVYHIKRRGRSGMLLMDHDYYLAWRDAIELMQRPNWREELEQSRRDFAAGRYRDLEDVVKELGLDRAAQPRRRAAASRPARPGRTKSTRRTPGARGRTAQR
jgi:PHD/YefM family antitoxin component YafN of YafNO toxin-antitoxin module